MADTTTSLAPVSQSLSTEEGVRRKTEREYYIRTKDGDKIAGNYTVKNGDFARFLGYAPPTDKEKSGEEKPSAARIIELALQKQMNEVGESTTKHGMEYRNWYITWGDYTNSPGREKDLIKSGVDAFNASMEKDSDLDLSKVQHMGNAEYMRMLNKFQRDSADANMRYLEMQYKFEQAGKSESMISNLMKTRHEAISRAIHESR